MRILQRLKTPSERLRRSPIGLQKILTLEGLKCRFYDHKHLLTIYVNAGQLLSLERVYQGVLFPSAGNARNPPLWEEFLQNAVKRYNIRSRHIKSAIKEGDYLHACEWIKTRLDEDWIQFLRDEFVVPAYKPSSIHNKIFRLDQRVYIFFEF